MLILIKGERKLNKAWELLKYSLILNNMTTISKKYYGYSSTLPKNISKQFSRKLTLFTTCKANGLRKCLRMTKWIIKNYESEINVNCRKIYKIITPNSQLS